MYRTVSDFVNDWTMEAEQTKRVLRELSDDKLGQAIEDGHSTLGWLGWHLTISPSFFAGIVGLEVPPAGKPEEEPTQAKEILDAYEQTAENFKKAAETTLTNETLVEPVDFGGQEIPRGAILRLIVNHQTHHRAQMTVLLRQAGLKVPGLYGPTKEDQE